MNGEQAAQRVWLTPGDLTLLVGINVVWGLNLVTSKLGVAEIPPLLFSALRLGLVAVVLYPVLRRFHGQMRTLLLAATLTGAASFALLLIGLRISKDVSTVAIATQLGVPFTTLLSVLMLGEVIHWRRKLGITLAFAGVMVIGFDPRVFSYWPGLLCVVLSSFTGALGLIYIKRLRGIGALELQAWIAAVGLPVLLMLSLMFEMQNWHMIRGASWMAWGALLFSALGSSLLAHSGLFYLIKRYPVTSVSPLTLLSPLFSMLFGVTLLSDRLTPRMLFGGLITLVGVLIVALRDRRIVDTGT